MNLATAGSLFHATPRPKSEKIVFPNPVHLSPSGEYAIVFVPLPTATNLVLFHATPRPESEKIAFPTPVHLIPSKEKAIVWRVP